MTIEERAEKISQLIWLDVSEPQLPLKDRYRLMKDRIISGLNTVHTEGALEENAKWEQWTGQSRHPHPMCRCSIPDPKETATERQTRILKDKRDYSFRRFMFGRMNMDKKRKETP